MKEINISSLAQARIKLSPQQFSALLQYSLVEIKDDELLDLSSFVKTLKVHSSNVQIFEKYFIGYKIPQISKEFDLLKFGNNYNINIELKSKSTPEKIKKQLIRNQYYLDFLRQKTYCYSYVTNEETLYSLDEAQNLKAIEVKELVEILCSQEEERIYDIDSLFNPSNYLVSPLNSTKEFIRGKYFLTAQQEEIRKSVLQQLKSPDEVFISICGKAGTGKTLLTYDIAKEFISKSEKVLLLHCGHLNEGHYRLKNEYGWEISSMKFYKSFLLQNYSLVVIDETQRVYPNQLEFLIQEVKKWNGKCIFSYDSQQWLRKWEFDNNIAGKIKSDCSSTNFELTEKIRTNREIASFTKCLFHKNYNIPILERSNIQLTFFDNYLECQEYLRYLKRNNWKIINYTPSTRDLHPYENFALENEDNAHSVIGQEFDKVVAVIDSYFYYNGNDLSTSRYQKKPYYHPTKMLFQIVTRTRRKLHVVIVNNNEVMERCLNILNNNQSTPLEREKLNSIL